MKKYLILVFVLILISSVYGACTYVDQGVHGIEIEGVCYNCGVSDGVCPEDFDVICDVVDCDCSAYASDPKCTGAPPVGGCELISAVWTSDKSDNTITSVEEGTKVYLQVSTSNCNGETLNFKVWENDLGPDDSAKVHPGSITVSGDDSTVYGEWIAEWSIDYGTDPEYLFVAYTDTTDIESLPEDDLTVTKKTEGPACTVGGGCTTTDNCPGEYDADCNCVDVAADGCPAVEVCELASAAWVDANGNSVSSIEEGSKVYLKVSTSNCNGETLYFDIWEKDWGEDETVGKNPDPVDITVDSGFIKGEWTAEWQDDASGDPEYAFVAGVSADISIYFDDPLLTVTKKVVGPAECETCEDYAADSTCNIKTCGDVSCFLGEGFLGVNHCYDCTPSTECIEYLDDDSSTCDADPCGLDCTWYTDQCDKTREAPPDCVVNSAEWVDGSGNIITSVEEGTKVYLQVGSSNCVGETFDFEVWEYDGKFLPDDHVIKEPSSVTVSGDEVKGVWVSEWQDDGDNPPEYYFIISIAGEPIMESDLLDVTKKAEPPPAAQCVLTSAKWTNKAGTEISTVTADTKVYLQVGSSNCNGEILYFEIWEKDWGVDEAVGKNPDPVTITVDSGVVKGEWITEWLGGVVEGDPEYAFAAAISEDISIYFDDPLLTVTKKAGEPPETAECEAGKYPGDVCTTAENCDGVYNTECACNDKPDDSCPEAVCATIGDACEVESCPGIVNDDCACADVPGDDCPSTTTCTASDDCVTLDGCAGSYSPDCACIDELGDDCPADATCDARSECETDEGCAGEYSPDCACIDVYPEDDCPAYDFCPPEYVSPDDKDCDGLLDTWETEHGLNPEDPNDVFADPDKDGLVNYEEYLYGTDPQKADSDGDGVDDGGEITMGSNPNVADDFVDIDGDGIPDAWEENYDDFDPATNNDPNADTDGDGLSDYDEFLYGTDPGVDDLGDAYAYCDLGYSFVGFDAEGWPMCVPDAGADDMGYAAGCVGWECGECIDGEMVCSTMEGCDDAVSPCDVYDESITAGIQEPIQQFPIFTWLNLIITSLILIGFYMFVHKKK